MLTSMSQHLGIVKDNSYKLIKLYSTHITVTGVITHFVTVPFRFNSVARAKFELARPICCRLRAFYCLYVTLRYKLIKLHSTHITVNV